MNSYRFVHVDFSGNRLQVEVAGAPVDAMQAGWDCACMLLGTMDPWHLEKIDYAPAKSGVRSEAQMALTFTRIPPPRLVGPGDPSRGTVPRLP